jgi:small nuclear ribonucleoprotein (snRNP)-like protein
LEEAFMTGFREFVAISLVECLFPVGFPQEARAMAATARSEGIRQKVEQLGAGAEVLVQLKGQRIELRGTIESFDDSAIRLRPGRAGEQKTVRYADVTRIEFSQRKYRAEGPPDPGTVRRVVVELGVGRKVHVRTQDRNTLVGRIARLDAEQLSIKIGDGGPVNVSYAQIRELRSGMSGVTKAVVYTATACGILLLITVVSLTVNPPG